MCGLMLIDCNSWMMHAISRNIKTADGSVVSIHKLDIPSNHTPRSTETIRKDSKSAAPCSHKLAYSVRVAKKISILPRIQDVVP